MFRACILILFFLFSLSTLYTQDLIEEWFLKKLDVEGNPGSKLNGTCITEIRINN